MRRLGRIFRWLLLLAVLAVIAVLVFAPRYIAGAQNPVDRSKEWPVSEQARALHRRLVIGDLHADPLLWDRNLVRERSEGHVDLPRLDRGNVAVQVFTTVTKSPSGQNYDSNSADTSDNITPLVIAQLRPVQSWFSLKERALDQAHRLNRMAEANPDLVRVIHSRADLDKLLADRAAGARVVGAVLGMEGAHPLEGQIANLGVMEGAGSRLIGLTHFFDNETGGSLHGESNQGLTAFGRELVQRMVDQDIIIDLAHASPQMVSDVLAMPGTRPMLSHTGIRSVCDNHRNLPDDLMQQIVAKGGIVGIGFWEEATCDDTPAGIARSIKGGIDVLGEDAVALGSDFDGAVKTRIDAADLPALTQALMDEGLTEAQIAKVMGGNMMRYLSETLPPG